MVYTKAFFIILHPLKTLLEQAAAIPNSLQCDECLKKFRNSVTAEFHATRSGHTNFSESTDIIKPLTGISEHMDCRSPLIIVL